MAMFGNSAILQPPLYVEGQYIKDGTHNPVRLACVNWQGSSMQSHVVGGLDKKKLDSIINTIKSFGFNCIRMPLSHQFWDDQKPVEKRRLSKNYHLHGKIPSEILDIVIEKLGKAGILTILNDHLTESGWCCTNDRHNSFWHSDKYPEEVFFSNWERMAERYKDNKWVIGADLRNELRHTGNGVNPVTPKNLSHYWEHCSTYTFE